MDPNGNVDISRIPFDLHALPQHRGFGENFDSCLAQSPYRSRNESLSMHFGDAYTLSDALTPLVMEICPSVCMTLKCVSLCISEAGA